MNYSISDHFTTKSAILPVLFLMMLVSGCGSEKEQKKPQQAIDVKVETASATASSESQNFPGLVESNNQANLSTIVMGTVTKVSVDIGARVKKGDVLIRIKDDQILAQKSQLEANKIQAEANLRNTEKNYNRIKNLYAEESATSKELDDISTMFDIAKANLEALEARLREVNEMLAYTTIKAPFDGIVARKFVSAGDMAAPGQPLVAIADPATVKITANVPEQWIGMIKEGDNITVSIAAAGIKNQSAVLTAVSEAADPMSRQYAIEARLTDKDLSAVLKTGMFAQIGINLNRRETLFIPKSALVNRGQLTGVYTLSDDDKAVLRWVRTGQDLENDIEILSGLKSGEQFITEVTGAIRQGQRINIKQ